MATTTATLTLSSADLLSDNLSLSATMNLYKGDTTATGLDQFRMERFILAPGTGQVDLIEATTAASEDANYVYICNKNTDATHYVTISIGAEVIGSLYAGDWMFIPWSNDESATAGSDDPSGDDTDIAIQAFTASNTIEYALFHVGETLLTHTAS